MICSDPAPVHDTYQDDLAKILEFVREKRSIDFNAYKPGTVKRRIDLRLLQSGMSDYNAYSRHLSADPAEIDLLLDALTINVSRFFRNPLVFEILKEHILPTLIDTSPPGGLRIWCAGCAGGEEAYSIAILLKEISPAITATVPAFILATDIDRSALAFAASASYRDEALTEVKKAVLEKYFVAENNGYRLTEEIRSLVTFAWHDLTTSQPPKEGIFSNYHLILCRNTIIYFNRELGERTMEFLSGVLASGGCLVLGEAETIPSRLHRDLREAIPRTRIFRKEVT
ncbi:MAG: protein-glutamate O-methyltransferase CheR [Candidatus Deferrimicrobium sp.]